MSVYRRKKQGGAPEAEYSFDFRRHGHRFSGPTGCTTKREAEQFVKALKTKIDAGVIDSSKPMTYGAAATGWYEARGQFHAKPTDTIRRLAWLQEKLGLNRKVSDIDDAMVAALVTARRKQGVSNTTVNRDIIEPLRAILRWAEKNKAGVQRIDWREHTLKEAQKRVREASVDEEAEIRNAMRKDYLPAIDFAFLTGCRLAEIVGLTWPDVNLFTDDLTVLGKGKKRRSIPMTPQIRTLLLGEHGHDPVHVFTYVALRTRGGRIRGQRYPITMNGLKTAWRRLKPDSVKNFRFHDMRHTAASRIVRVTGDLRIAQELLGHEDITTTMCYAHLSRDDLRRGMEATHNRIATQNPTKSGDGYVKPMKSGDNLK